MSSVLFDSGDLERLNREARLTEQAPRQLPENDRSPTEDPLDVREEENPFDIMLDGLLAALQQRIKEV